MKTVRLRLGNFLSVLTFFWGTLLAVDGQVFLKAGDIWSFQSEMPFRGYSFELTNSVRVGRVRLEFSDGGLGAGSALRCEMFEGSVQDNSPIAATVFTGPLIVG